MNPKFFEFIHPHHFDIFVEVARECHCHILVRKTGYATMKWIGKPGYTGKRGDLKAKTADQNIGRYETAGLVCSPFLQPDAFSKNRIGAAYKEWSKCSHLITEPRDNAGFHDQSQLTRCDTPYIIQTNPNHRHYGCVALVDFGLLMPRYIHGDYDLYAIIPAGKAFDPGKLSVTRSDLGAAGPERLGLEERLRFFTTNWESPLSFRVANLINTKIAERSADFMGGLMVNHGEQINLGQAGQTGEAVLAIMPAQMTGEWAKILDTPAEHDAFYRNA